MACSCKWLRVAADGCRWLQARLATSGRWPCTTHTTTSQPLPATCSHCPSSHLQPLATTCKLAIWASGCKRLQQVAASGCFFGNQNDARLLPLCTFCLTFSDLICPLLTLPVWSFLALVLISVDLRIRRMDTAQS